MLSRAVANLLQPEPMGVQAALFSNPGNPFTTLNTSMEKVWWTEDRIQKTVTKSFVLARIQPELWHLLDRPLPFGQALTDSSYLEYILQQAQRVFLILLEVGLPDQIFSVIDASWDDGDLPLSVASIRGLSLLERDDEPLARKIYQTQFNYLLRQIEPGNEVEYGDDEIVPLDYSSKRATNVGLRRWPRVTMCERPNFTLVQRSFPLWDKTSEQSLSLEFKLDVETAKYIEHIHIAPVWATYTSKGRAHVLTPFVCEHTLKSFLDQQNLPQLQRLTKDRRRKLYLEWMLCLVDAVAYLHSQGMSHTAIRPSNILIDANNAIVFSDIGSLESFQRDKKHDLMEAYIYSAPEARMEAPLITTNALDVTLRPLSRRMSAGSRSSSGRSRFSSGASNAPSPTTSVALPDTPCSTAASTIAPLTAPNLSLGPPSLATSPRESYRVSSGTKLSHTSSTEYSMSSDSRYSKVSSMSSRQMSPLAQSYTQSVCTDDFTLCSSPPSYGMASPIAIAVSDLRPSRSYTKEQSDMFSLGCVFADLLTALLKYKTTDFTKHRSARRTTSGRTTLGLDPSFHANQQSVHTWLTLLDNHATKKGDTVFRGIPYLVELIKTMIDPNPDFRPSAQTVRRGLLNILTERSKIENLHCKRRVEAPVSPPAAPQLKSVSAAEDWPLPPSGKSGLKPKRSLYKLVVP